MTVTVSMSAVWVKLITILCLTCTVLSDPIHRQTSAQSGPESSGVLWRDVGGAVTIQCRCPEPGQEYLHVKKGLSRDFQVLLKVNNSDENTFAKNFTGRLQINGKFPNLDILIKNLTSEDTGPYWCVYQKYDKTSHRTSDTEGKGSVLLVVRDTKQECEPSSPNLFLVSVVTSTAVAFCIMMGILICVTLQTKAVCTTVKPRRVPTSDVHEDIVEHADVRLQVTNRPETL